MIVRWGIGELGPVLSELGVARPLLVTSERFGTLNLPIAYRFTGVLAHSPVRTVEAAKDAAREADGLVGLGGGSAIDTAKAVSAATELPLIAVPTTYAGSEWTPYYGMRDEARRAKTGGSGAHTIAVVYEPELTLTLPPTESVGTAMNALAHAAEALYAGPLDDATTGARLIARWLPVVARDGSDVDARTRLLEGAMHAGMALAVRGMALAHAMAQALGGHYGVSHGAMNALCLPPALRFNAAVVPEAIVRLAEAMETDDAPAQVVDLARRGGFARLRDFGIAEDELDGVAQAAAQRPAARANPRPATAEDVATLLREIW